MGGCRCIFRECRVATSRHPRMHFFRFPIKDPPRMVKWVKMAKVPNILTLPVSMQRNKCVCARHFRDECFMNYMKDKLVTTAVPTLERIKGGYALDYEDGDKPKIVKLPDAVLPHMIPPPGFECPLHLEELENLDYLDESYSRKIKPRNSSSGPKRKMSTQDNDSNASKKMKILNTEAPAKEVEITDSDAYITKFVQFVDFAEEQEDKEDEDEESCLITMDDCIELEDESQDQSNEGDGTDTVAIEIEPEHEIANVEIVSPTIIELPKTSTSTRTQRSIDVISEDYEMQLEKERSKYTSYEEESSRQQMQLVEALQTAKNELEIKTLQYNMDTQELKTKVEQLNAANSELESQNENLVISNNLLNQRLQSLEEKHANLLVQHKQLEANNFALQKQQQQQQVSTVSTSNNAKTVNSAPAAIPQPFSKAQLFNGIKKYLSSSMVALVRMEMFGSTERQWKDDEKQASLDLLMLGENVYRYFTDEWRFRLPSLRQVLNWKNENCVQQDDDEDL